MSIRDNRSHLITIWLYLTKLTLSRVRPKQSVTCNLATFYTNFFNVCVVAVSKETMGGRIGVRLLRCVGWRSAAAACTDAAVCVAHMRVASFVLKAKKP